ncbi:hypothetical protein GCM10009609_43730 [Pseudonocardia aurantiaca]|uniref:ATP-binding protein n=1 Tax=Pseudonocardia aurantiaca TaxID=75290 RepID=A0ABW4G1T2_9PSEU
MTITTGLHLLSGDELAVALEEHLAPRLASLIGRHGPGHCMRCDDLDVELATRLCRRLRSSTGAQVHVLGRHPDVAEDVAASSTKIVELRNPAAGDELRPPLLVFVPPGARASAEDSFGVATFEQVTFGAVYETLAEELLSNLPEETAAGVRELFAVLRDEKWPVSDGRARCRYLLTISRNDHDHSAAGAAVHELGLVPDPELFTGSITSRAAHNLRTVRRLDDSPRPDRARVLGLGLTDPEFRRELTEFASSTGLSDPLRWTRSIVAERENWRFFFGNWSLREDTSYDEIGIEVDDIDLPVAGDGYQDTANPALRGITGQRYLPVGAGGMREITVPFRLDRDPHQVAGLARFRIQLMAEYTDGDTSSGTPTEIATAMKISSTARLGYKAKLRKLTQSGLEEGWHYVRVTPLDSDGLPIGLKRDGAEGRPSQESERFYVLPDGDHDGPPPTQRAHRAAGVTQAARAFEFSAAAEGKSAGSVGHRSTRWQDPPRGAATTGPRTLVCDFGPDGLVDVTLSAHLVELQQRIITNPAVAGHWGLALSVTDAASSVGAATLEAGSWADHVDAGRRDAFLAARAALFARIANPSGDTSEPTVVEGCDLLPAIDQVVSYVDAYATLLDERHGLAEHRAASDVGAVTALADLARIDTVTVTLTDHRDTAYEIVLVAPTHPLRILWLAAWAVIGHRWASEADRATSAAAGRALARLRPLGHPLVVPRPAAQLALAAFDLTPYWGVCLPDGTADPQGLLALLQTALGVPGWDSSGDIWSGAAIADRFELYLRQHPYVRTLLVNAVNIGRGEEIAQAVTLLRDRPGYAEVEFDLRLYVGDPEAPGSADAVLELLDGPDALAHLAVAVRDRSEFHDSTEDAAHVTVLFDALSAEHIGTTTVDRDEPRRLLPVHGLVQEMLVEYSDDPDAPTIWRKRPRIGVAWELDGAEEITDVLSTLPAALASVAADLATGQFVANRVPEVSLALTADDSSLLDHAHRCSDWVITVDRTLGIEFFDAPSRPQRPDYVIDYAPETGNALGHHMVVSSRSLDELRTLLTPILRDSGLDVPARHVRTFFDQLRLLSGRLAFKIASLAPNQRTEVLGLALARLYLERHGVLANQVLVPLDAHLDLYDEVRRTTDTAAGNLRRTDLALFDLDPTARVLTCRLVEVKCYTSEASVSGYQRLKDDIRTQLTRSAEVLGTHFDPTIVRPDRVAKNYQLASLLRFYLDRALRHDVVTAAAGASAGTLLDSLDGGYQLQFTRSALIFDLTGRSSETEVDGGIEFTRIGRDVIQELLDGVPTGPFGRAIDPTSQPADAGSPMDLVRRPRAAFEANPPRPPASSPVDTPSEGAAGPIDDVPDRAPAVRPDPTERSTQPAPPTGQAEADQARSQPDSADQHAAAYEPDIIVGTSRPTPQFGIIGETAPDKLVAMDLNETHTVSLFGVQGGGKSYTLGTVIEAATMPAAPLNRLAHPLATIVFHYSATQDYAPEFTSMNAPNDDTAAVARLRERFGIEPQALDDVVLLAPRDQCDRRREEYPGLDVRALTFSSSELQAAHWKFLMGAVGNQATYVRQLNRIMKSHRDDLRLDVIRSAVEASSMTDHIKQLALQRLDLAGDYIDDGARIGDLIVPGRLIIVDLRDELIEKDEALGLFVVLMQLFADARGDAGGFNKLVVFDEAHKYIESPDLVKGLVESVREMRHKGMSVLVASQDPPSVPVSLIELSDHIIVHKFTSPAWLRHLQKANAALSTVTADRLAELKPGEAYLWASKSTDATFSERMVKIRTRPRLTRHGGGTRTATGT